MREELPAGFRPGNPTARSRADQGDSEATFDFSEYPPAPGETESTPKIYVNVDLQKLGIQRNEGGFLVLQFREGVSLAEGKELYERLHKLIAGVSLCQFRC